MHAGIAVSDLQQTHAFNIIIELQIKSALFMVNPLQMFITFFHVLYHEADELN